MQDLVPQYWFIQSTDFMIPKKHVRYLLTHKKYREYKFSTLKNTSDLPVRCTVLQVHLSQETFKSEEVNRTNKGQRR